MAKDHSFTVRLGPEHLFALDVISAAEDVPRSGAIRWLIESYAASRRNPQLLSALPVELHDQVPDMLTVGRDRVFDPESDVVWIDAHHADVESDA